jgi:hypothetical protein
MPSSLLRRSLIAFALAFVAVPSAAQANTFTVDSTVDMADASLADGQCRTTDDTCTLRAAIQQANRNAGPDRIGFALSGGLIRLDAELPAISTDMDIVGPGASNLTLWGNASAHQRVFGISAWAQVRISGLTITHGFADAGGGGVSIGYANVTIADCLISSSAADKGAGISIVLGSLKVERSTVAGNSATEGGGLFALNANVDIVDSTFDGNAANLGGAIRGEMGPIHVTGSTLSHNFALLDGGAVKSTSSTIDLLNSTLVGNSAWSEGGAISSVEGDITAFNSTVSGNSAASGGGIVEGRSMKLRATIVAGNHASNQSDIASFLDVASDGGNLIGDGDGVKFDSRGGPADQVGTAAAPIDPKLARDSSGAVRLRDAGGPTKTVTLLPGSPAIDRGADAPAPATDQRGFARRLGAHVDVGAVEGAWAAPVVPGTQWTVEDTPLVFSARTGNAISVSGVGDGTISVAGAGTLALAGKRGAVKVAGDGTGKVTLSGTIADMTEALDGLVFTPAPDANGPMSLNVTTGEDGESATVPIQVTEINDPPVAAEDALDADSRLIPFSELLRNDSAGPANEADQELTITGVGEPKGGTAELSSAGVVFTPDPGYTGPAGFAYTLRDNGSSNHKHDAQSATGYARFDIKAAAVVPVTPAPPANPGTVPSPQPPVVVAPTVVRVSPVRSSRASVNVVAVFSQPMDPRTLSSATVTLTTRGGSVPATVRYDAAHRRVVLDPRGRLVAGMQYTATIRAGVRDAAGVPLAKTTSWKFTIRRGVIL